MTETARVGGASSGRVELMISDAEIRASRLTSRVGTTIDELQRGGGSIERAEALLNESSEVLAELTREARAGGTIDRLDALRQTLATTVQSARRERAIGAVAERRGTNEGATITRDVRLAAQTMRRTGDPASFAGALVRGGSDARMRELSRVSESDLRAALANAGVTGEAADRAIDALKSNIALPFQRRVHQQGARRLEQAAARLERAAAGIGPEFSQQLARLQSPQGQELIASLRLVGAGEQADELSRLVDRRADAEELRLPLARAVQTLADVVRERATDVGQGEGGAALSASPSREMPWADAEVQQRWSAGGIVADAIREHTEASNAERANDARVGRAILTLANIPVAVVAGSAGSVAATAGREAMEVSTAWGDANDAAADAAAELGSMGRAREEKTRAVIATAGAVGAVTVEAFTAGVIHGAHVVPTDATLAPKGALASAEAAASAAVETAKHMFEAAALGTPH